MFLERAQVAGDIYITFDDGPDPRMTIQILDILDKTGSKATFFLVGMNIEKYPEIVKEIARRGHDIGYHSYRHTHGFKTGPIQSYADNANNAILRLTGINTDLYRPPFGKLNIFGLLSVIRNRFHLVYWNIDPRDYAAVSSDTITNHVMEHIQPGSVVLFHDGRINESKLQNISITAEALEHVLAGIQARGLKTGRISEIFQRKASEII